MFSKKEVSTAFEMNARDDSTASERKFKDTEAESLSSEIKREYRAGQVEGTTSSSKKELPEMNINSATSKGVCHSEMKEVGTSLEKSNNSANHSTASRPVLGLLLTCLASVFYQMTAVLVKHLSYISHGQLSLLRNIGTIAGSLPLAVYHEKKIYGEKKHRLHLFFRALFGATGLYMTVIAYKYLPLAEATVVIATLPVATTLLARTYLKESCGVMHVISLLTTVAGVLLTVRIPELIMDRNTIQFNSSYFGGLVAAIAGVLFLSCATVMIRKLKNIHFSVVTLYNGSVGAIENVIINAIAFPYVFAMCGSDQTFCMLIGVFGFMSNCCHTLSVQNLPAGISTIVRSAGDIILMIVFEAMFFNEYPDVYVICGATLVIVSVIITGLGIWLLTLPQNSKIRNKLSWILI